MNPQHFVFWLLSGGPDREADRGTFCARVILDASATPQSSRCSTISWQTSVSFADHAIDVAIEMRVDDWQLVGLLAKAVVGKQLSVLPCRCINEGGDHSAMVGMIAHRPALIVYATPDKMIVVVGGLDRSAVIHDGQLSILSHQVSHQMQVPVVARGSERQRNTPVAARAREGKMRKARRLARERARLPDWVNVPLPRMVVGIRGILGEINEKTKLIPIFRRDKGRRVDSHGLPASGPAASDPLYNQMRAGLGVAVLQAYHRLLNLNLTTRGAKDHIALGVAESGLGVETLLSIGRKELQAWTQFDNEKELKLASETTDAAKRSAGYFGPRADRASRIKHEVLTLETLTKALRRTRAITQAFEKTVDYSPQLAEIEIGIAYNVGGELTTADLITIAMALDVNATAIVKKSEVSGSEFEVFRFIGMLRRGANAFVYHDHLHALADAIVRDKDARRTAQEVLCVEIGAFYGATEILDAIERIGADEVLYATRRSRRLGSGVRVGAAPRKQLI